MSDQLVSCARCGQPLEDANCPTVCPCTGNTPNGATERSSILADSDYTRRLAIEALENGRLELGAGLARLALNAARAARAIPYVPTDTFRGRTVSVPLIGATRDEQPHAWPTEDTASIPAPRSSRCTYSDVAEQGNPNRAPLGRDTCWGAVYLEPDTGVWRHLNASLDAHHTPAPRQEDMP